MKKRKKKGGGLLAALCMALIGMACGVLMAVWLEYSLGSNAPVGEFLRALALMFVMMYMAVFLQLIVHEAGHLLFGLISGYKFCSFRIGSLMWIMDNGKMRLRRFSLAGTGGQCLMCPPDMVDGRIPYVLYNLGGSLMNAISAVVFVGVYFLCGDTPWLALFFLMMSVVGIGLALMNGIPLRFGTVDNDGYNAMSLGKSPAALHSLWIQLKVNQQISQGVRLKDMPAEWFQIPDKDEMLNSMTVVMAVFYANRLMDAHCFEEAGQLIDQLCSEDTAIVGLHRGLLMCDRLYCELVSGRERQVIEGVRSKEQVEQIKFMKQMEKNPSVIRTDYAFALLEEKDTAKAEKLRAQFERCAKNYPYAGEIEGERELLQIADEAAGVQR